MMRTRTLLILFAILICLGAASAWAGSTIDLKQSGGTLTPLGGVGDAAKVSVVGAGGTSVGGCTPTAAAPTYVEGTDNALSCDLIGALRTLNAYLQFGEDSTNNLMMVGPGATRITTFSSVTSATTSTTQILPIGVKTFMAYMGGASETKAFDLTIYGNWQNSTTGGRSVCRLYVPSTASVTHIETRCPDIEENFSYWYYTADVYTSASAASLTLYAMH